TPQKARHVLAHTGCDGVMIGRAAQGRPWLCGQIGHYLRHGDLLPVPSQAQVGRWLLEHVHDLHEFYGEGLGVRVARKHLSWVLQREPGGDQAWRSMARIEQADAQRAAVEAFFLPALEAAA
ncbi:MAG: tRNA-dihydrouridine synthase, partial [Xanthomonadales bacterium]|nr:tRNA-dihydrouridine synthase [Xanthomonadales bacterium]